ncbi:hypothetical protein CEXT_366011 [Caerostris extrusa]|uniref:Uncharacterized protein n=1 Tax=Caerostris extrusa TaxID=172846 RepID=A0AAV4TJA0_CAEEX|nr:hypothetical protein CEXT_366011 [Caerostris extrusa]
MLLPVGIGGRLTTGAKGDASPNSGGPSQLTISPVRPGEENLMQPVITERGRGRLTTFRTGNRITMHPLIVSEAIPPPSLHRGERVALPALWAAAATAVGGFINQGNVLRWGLNCEIHKDANSALGGGRIIVFRVEKHPRGTSVR